MTEINKEGFNDHLENLKKPNTSDHDQILSQLLKDVKAVNYEGKGKESMEKKLNDPSLDCDHREAIEEEIEKFKLNEKHFLIISIEEVINLTKYKKWGICKNQDFIYLYNGAYWKSIDKEEFQKFLGEASEKMGVGKYTAKYFQFREKLFRQFIASEYFPTPPRAKDRVFINLLNGTFEVTEKPILRPFDCTDFIRYQLPFKYDERATAPKFIAYLNKVLPEADKQKVLAEFLGYVFVPQSHLKLEKALFLYGGGANGKSVFYEIMKALLGSHNTSEFSLQSLTDTTGYYRALIADKLVNYASEISGKLESTKFKSLASGEPMEARLPYGQPMIIEDYAKLIFNTNELPKDVEFNNAFFRRFIIIPFEVTIPENEQNKTLHKEIIRDELPGVFNWVLDGLKRLLVQNGFSESPSINKALEDFRTESDTVKRFLDEFEYKSNNENKIPLKDLYQEYKSFAIDEGHKILANPSFSKRLKALNIQMNREAKGMQVFVLKDSSENGKANL
ncbi:MAG: phage/plasmid primase, P4 family [Fulvivirga sp.]